MKKWTPPEYNFIVTDNECKKILKEINKNCKAISIDVETTGLSPQKDKIIGFSIVGLLKNKLSGFYFPLRHKLGPKATRYGFSLIVEDNDFKSQVKPETAFCYLKPVLMNPSRTIIGQNIKFDLSFLYNEGITEISPKIFDVRVAESLIDSLKVKQKRSGALSLKSIILDYVKIDQDMVKKWKDFDKPLDECSIVEVGKYCIDDSAYAFVIYQSQKEIIDRDFAEIFYNLEMPLIPVLRDIEQRGIRIDLKYLEKLDQRLRKDISKTQQKVSSMIGRNLNLKSPVQLKKYLYEELKLKPRTKKVRRKEGTVQILGTDTDTIKNILSDMKNKESKEYKILSSIVTYLGLFSLHKTHVERLLKQSAIDGRVYTSYDPVGASSGRFSSEPNLQNIPRNKDYDIRRAFVPDEGKIFVIGDWSGMQLRIAAAISRDEEMLYSFQKDEDLHAKTACAIFKVKTPTSEQRYQGKTVNFSVLFGSTEYGIATQLKCSKQKAKEIINNFYKLYNGFYKWKKKLSMQIEREGFASTVFGRKRKYDFTTIYPEHEKRSVINSVIQGTEADILKKVLINLHKMFKKNSSLKAEIVAHIHDEIICQCPYDKVTEVKKLVEKTMTVKLKDMILPVEISVKKSLSENVR